MEKGCHSINPAPQTASHHPGASTLTGSGRRESRQGQGPVSGPASTRTPLHTAGESPSRSCWHQAPPQPWMGPLRWQSGRTDGYSSCPSQKNVRFLTAPISSIRLMARASWETLWPDPCGDSQGSKLRDSQGPPRRKKFSLVLPTAPPFWGLPSLGWLPEGRKDLCGQRQRTQAGSPGVWVPPSE